MPHTNEAAIQAAIDAFSASSTPSLRAIATLFGVNRNTLQRRLCGRPTRSEARQSQLLLSPAQEQALLKWILELEAVGHALSHAQIREMAGLVSFHSGGPAECGTHWVRRFVQRHNIVHTKVGRAIDHLRVEAVTPEALTEWFALFKRIKDAGNIKPQNMWNMDETGLALGHCKNQLVIRTSNTKYAYIKSPENREWVSIIETISATGRRCRPICIFKGKSIQSTWFTPERIPDFLFTTSENGWTSNDIGLRWLDEVFLPETANNGEKRLLLIDGHGSHISSEFMWKCYENDVLLIYLIPHSSHVLQPLDLSCFSPLKSRYRKELMDVAKFDDSAPIKKIRFLEYYNKARDESLNSTNIKSGWRAAGLVPFDSRKVIRSSQVTKMEADVPKAPQTPPQRKRKASPNIEILTPQDRHQLEANLALISKSGPISRGVRLLFRKTAKGLDTINARTAQQTQQIDRQSNRLEQLQQKKQKKTAIDSNERFADIAKIKEAQTAMAAQTEAWTRQNDEREQRNLANELTERRMQGFMVNWHVNSVNTE